LQRRQVLGGMLAVTISGFLGDTWSAGVDASCRVEQQYIGHDHCFRGTCSFISKVETAAFTEMLVPSYQIMVPQFRRLYDLPWV
jgi:hypothetical protein